MCDKQKFLPVIVVLAEKNKKWLGMWGKKQQSRTQIADHFGAEWEKIKIATISPSAMAQNWLSNLQSAVSPQFAF